MEDYEKKEESKGTRQVAPVYHHSLAALEAQRMRMLYGIIEATVTLLAFIPRRRNYGS